MNNNHILLKTEGLYKKFGENVVLNNINFELKEGEVVSLVGKSGAGKTTILRCITGLEKPSGGNIIVDDKYVSKFDEKTNTVVNASKNELHEIRKSLGMVFQNYHLFPHMTVLQNVTLALTEVYKMSKEDAKEKAIDMLKSLGLGDKTDSKPFSLSGGQKQRVAIARSCVTNPKLLCFDEPTAALDTALISDIIKIIRDFAKKGMGILIISHDERFVRDVSDRILLMKDGQIVEEMTPSDFSEKIRS